MDLHKIFKDFNDIDIFYNRDLKAYTNFKLGGPADAMAFPKSEKDIVSLLEICFKHNVSYVILGKASNLIVRDGGVEGLVIFLRENFSKIEHEKNIINAQAGISMQALANYARDLSLSGAEFIHGIPGSLGGGVSMNAGAYGGEIKDIIQSVRVLDRDLNIREFSNEEMNFRYRNSRVFDEGLLVLSAKLKLQEKDKEGINALMKDLMQRRISKQPLEYPSAGSTFKRPEGYFAGKLIDDAGLRGFRLGDAQISEKHCGFVINRGEATASEVIDLIETVQKIIYDKYGIEIEREVKIIGRQ
ncbi:UDP-N-acetylmuramate dehydrogenase [Peptoniphilus sp. GNH]|nr:UDP-N-acetylmuramate dehydrogenase [Peptoniphilus sp. GNH]